MIENFNIPDKLLKAPVLASITIFVVCAAYIIFKTRSTDGQTKSKNHRVPGMPKIPEALERHPERLEGGQRRNDSTQQNPAVNEKRVRALELAKKRDFLQAAKLLEEAQLQREAIDLLEANHFLDEAAAILMSINRPNRAAVLFERNKQFEKAAAYYLRAKLPEDAKRCCKQIPQFTISLSTELAVLFAEAGDKFSAIRLLAGINDKNKIIKLTRDTFAYGELAVFLDNTAARKLLLESISLTDVAHMMQSMSHDHNIALTRARTWLNEGCKGEWLLPVMQFIGDKRDVAQKFAEHVDTKTVDTFAPFANQFTPDFISKNSTILIILARALHDAGHWHAAAVVYDKLNSMILSGKCWALCGLESKAIKALKSASGDLTLAEKYLAQLAKMGRIATSDKPLEDAEKNQLKEFFFNIDPDTEMNRAESPFTVAS